LGKKKALTPHLTCGVEGELEELVVGEGGEITALTAE